MQSRYLSLGQWLNKSWYIHTTETNDARNNLMSPMGMLGGKKATCKLVWFHLYNFECQNYRNGKEIRDCWVRGQGERVGKK